MKQNPNENQQPQIKHRDLMKTNFNYFLSLFNKVVKTWIFSPKQNLQRKREHPGYAQKPLKTTQQN